MQPFLFPPIGFLMVASHERFDHFFVDPNHGDKGRERDEFFFLCGSKECGYGVDSRSHHEVLANSISMVQNLQDGPLRIQWKLFEQYLFFFHAKDKRLQV